MSLKIGDKVKLANEPQPSTHSLRWQVEMDKLCGRIGTIVDIDGDGDCCVLIPGERSWWFSPKWLTPVNKHKLLLL